MCYPAGRMRFYGSGCATEHALPKETALALASAAEKIGFDLLLFGEGSGDIYAQQVGLLTGELLKLPVINAVSHIQRDGDKIIVERTLEEDVEIIELTLPAVLCVTSDINVPRIPSMKAILGAGKSRYVVAGERYPLDPNHATGGTGRHLGTAADRTQAYHSR